MIARVFVDPWLAFAGLLGVLLVVAMVLVRRRERATGDRS